ncbi:MAG: 16S rRNA (guanine(966)-N(2))-methyltransferase RsmD [Chloroflexota bacterium]|jgi:16S rRNA (guanine(966)-N(2))-methyltransferase RsmD
MRVISGKARGHKLKKVPGDSTRPITDRVKENLFNILGNWVQDTRWLDLFAGTGQVGIEALSRGASSAVFVDKTRSAIKTIQDNLQHTRLADGADVLHQDAFEYLRRREIEPFDVVFIAPPQYQELWSKVLLILDQHIEAYLAPQGMVIVQIDPKEYEEQKLKSLVLFDKRQYGNTLLCFYEGED